MTNRLHALAVLPFVLVLGCKHTGGFPDVLDPSKAGEPSSKFSSGPTASQNKTTTAEKDDLLKKSLIVTVAFTRVTIQSVRSFNDIRRGILQEDAATACVNVVNEAQLACINEKLKATLPIFDAKMAPALGAASVAEAACDALDVMLKKEINIGDFASEVGKLAARIADLTVKYERAKATLGVK